MLVFALFYTKILTKFIFNKNEIFSVFYISKNFSFFYTNILNENEMDQNSFQFKKCIRIIPFSSSVTAYERLSNLPSNSLNTLITVIENYNSHLPDWISPSLIKQVINKQTSSRNHNEEKQISKIYMYRNSDIGTEFLVKYKEESFPFSNWECEKDLLTNPSFPAQLNTFQHESFDFNLL